METSARNRQGEMIIYKIIALYYPYINLDLPVIRRIYYYLIALS